MEAKMQMCDIMERFVKQLPDEINDSNMYYDMAESAEAHGQSYLAEGLRMIAHDEYTHARFINDALHDHYRDVDCSVHDAFMMLEKRDYNMRI